MKKDNKDLSLTRELKYKDLQEMLTKEEEKKKNPPKNKLLEEEEIYLTQSFKPVKTAKKVKRVLLNLLLLLSILLLLVFLLFFFLYPIFEKYFFVTPKEVFTKSLDQIAEKVKLDEERTDSYFSLLSSFTLKTNMEKASTLNTYSYTSSFVYDFDNQNQLTEFTIHRGDDTYAMQLLSKDNLFYLQKKDGEYSYVLEKINMEKTPFKVIKNSLKEPKRYNRFIDKEVQYIKDAMDEKDMSKEKDELYFLGEKKNVTRFTYRLHEKEWKQFLENHNHFLLQDEEVLEDLSVLLGIPVEAIKDDLKEQNTPFKEIAFNLYFEKGDQFVGFDIEIDGFRRIYYYQYNQKFVFYLNGKNQESILAGENANQQVIEVSGEVGDTKKIEVKYNGKMLLSVQFLTYLENEVNLNYTLYGKEGNLNGSFVLTKEENLYHLFLIMKKMEQSVELTLTMQKKEQDLYSFDSIKESVLWNKEEFKGEFSSLQEEGFFTSLEEIYFSIGEIFKEKEIVEKEPVEEETIKEEEEEDTISDGEGILT